MSGNAKVVEAIRRQADQYLHIMVYGELVENPQVAYAQKLTSQLPESLNAVFYTASGSKYHRRRDETGKRHTGRTQIISFRQSYHGSTQGALSIREANTGNRHSALYRIPCNWV